METDLPVAQRSGSHQGCRCRGDAARPVARTVRGDPHRRLRAARDYRGVPFRGQSRTATDAGRDATTHPATRTLCAAENVPARKAHRHPFRCRPTRAAVRTSCLSGLTGRRRSSSRSTATAGWSTWMHGVSSCRQRCRLRSTSRAPPASNSSGRRMSSSG